jgi:hypothetical protein
VSEDADRRFYDRHGIQNQIFPEAASDDLNAAWQATGETAWQNACWQT